MIDKQTRHVVLLILVINISLPVQAFWGQETLSRLTNAVTSYVTDVFARPSEHKAAILIGTVATLGAGAVLVGAWRKATATEAAIQEQEQSAQAPLSDEERKQQIAKLHEREQLKEDLAEIGQKELQKAREEEEMKEWRLREAAIQEQEENEERQEQERLQREAEVVERRRLEEVAKRQAEVEERLRLQREAEQREAEKDELKRLEVERREIAKLRYAAKVKKEQEVQEIERMRRAYLKAQEEQKAAEQGEVSRALRQEGTESSTAQKEVSAEIPRDQRLKLQFLQSIGKQQPAAEKMQPPTNVIIPSVLFAARPPSPEVGSQLASSSSGPAQPNAPQVSPQAQAFIDSLGPNVLDWPELKNDDKAGREGASRIQAFMQLSLEDQAGVFEVLRFKLNDGNSVADVPVEECSWWSYVSNLVISLVSSFNNLFKHQSDEEKAAVQRKVVEDSFVQLHNAVRQHAYLQISMGDLKLRHNMTHAKEEQIGALLDAAIAQAEDEKNIDAMGLSASQIQNMEAEDRKLHFMVRVLRPRGPNGESVVTDQVALLTPVHGTFATSGPYGTGINNAENGPRLMAAAQRRADAEGVTLYVIIPNWNSEFKEANREEAACYILPLMQHWFNRFKDRVKFIDVMGHSEGNAVIAMILKGIEDKAFRKFIGWLSVCPTAGSDYIPVGCRARVTIWSPADALAFIASVTRFNTYRKQEGLKKYGIQVGELDSLFMNISLSYDGKPENHVTAKYRASDLYDVIFDIAQQFKGHYELSMNVVKKSPGAPQEILISVRRGKESCIELSPEKQEEIERISRLSEDRYRSLYPNNPDWHEKPHDLLNFAWKYPRHGFQEKIDGDIEDAQIAKSQGADKSMQRDLYERFQKEAAGRIKYGLDVKAGRIDVSDFVRQELSRLDIKDTVDQDAVLIGSFVHHVLTSSDESYDMRRLQGLLKSSPHRNTFIVDLIAYWRAKALMRNAYEALMHNAYGDERAKTSECAFQVLDSGQQLYDFIRGASNKSDAGKRIIGPGLLDKNSARSEMSESITLPGLACGADYIILTPLQRSLGQVIRFYITLARTESITQQTVKKGGTTLAAVRAFVLKPSGSEKIQSKHEPVAQQKEILTLFNTLVDASEIAESEKIEFKNRAAWGGIREIVAMMPRINNDTDLRKLLSTYDSLLVRIANETVIYARDEIDHVAFEDYLGKDKLEDPEVLNSAKLQKHESFAQSSKAYDEYVKNPNKIESFIEQQLFYDPDYRELKREDSLLNEYANWELSLVGHKLKESFLPKYVLRPNDYRDYQEPIEKYLMERRYFKQEQVSQPVQIMGSSSSSGSQKPFYSSSPMLPVSSGPTTLQHSLPWQKQFQPRSPSPERR